MTKNPFYAGDDIDLPPEVMHGEQKESVSIPEGRISDSKMRFGGEVAEQFEEQVINHQIPGYEAMRHRLLLTVEHLLQPDTTMLDLGTSTGRMIRDVILGLAVKDDHRITRSSFVGVDIEIDMLQQADARIESLRNEQVVSDAVQKHSRYNYLKKANNEDMPAVQLVHANIKDGIPQTPSCSIVTSILTLQFVPIEHRPRILKAIYDRLTPGGAFLLVEKVLSANPVIDDLLTELYYDDKRRNGIDVGDIIAKRRLLEGALIPLTHNANVELLEGAGFNSRKIDVFWRELQFEGIIALK